MGLCLDVEEEMSGDLGVHPQWDWGSRWWTCASPLESRGCSRTGSCLHGQNVSYSPDQGAPVPAGMACPLSGENGLMKHVVGQLHTRLPVAAPGPHCWLVSQLQAQAAVPGSWSMGQGSGVSPAFSLGLPDLQDLGRKGECPDSRL